MNKLLNNPNFNNIGEFWAIGETVEEVREVYDYLDTEVEKLHLLNK